VKKEVYFSFQTSRIVISLSNRVKVVAGVQNEPDKRINRWDMDRGGYILVKDWRHFFDKEQEVDLPFDGRSW